MTTNVSVTVLRLGCALHTHVTSIPAGQPVRASLGEARDLRAHQVCRQRLQWQCPAAMPHHCSLTVHGFHPKSSLWHQSRRRRFGVEASSTAKRDSKELGCATICSGNNMTDGADSDPWSFAESRTTGRFSVFQLLLQRVSISKPQFLDFKNICISLFVSF